MNKHQLKLCVTVTPTGEPTVRVSLGNQCYQQELSNSHAFEFDQLVDTDTVLTVELIGKSPLDPHTAVNLDSVEIFGIQDPKFVWAGEYQPSYPEPWASQQRQAGIDLPQTRTAQTYLGWNGIWQLRITVPVFVWMHQTQGLGLIYE